MNLKLKIYYLNLNYLNLLNIERIGEMYYLKLKKNFSYYFKK